MKQLFLFALIVMATVGCQSYSPIGMNYVGPNGKPPEACALYGDELSSGTRVTLRFMEAETAYEDDPDSVLIRLHRLTLDEQRRNLLFSLGELAYLEGKRTGSRDAFLLSAIAAYSYLEGDSQIWGPPPTPYSRRFRWSCDMYCQALGQAFAGTKPGTMELAAGVRALPIGEVDITLDLEGFPFRKEGLELLLADQFKVRGLDYHVRDSGLGAPLVAVVQQALETTAEDTRSRNRTSVTATAFLELEGDLLNIESGLSATLSLHSTYDAKSLTIGDHVIPLKSNQSAMVAYGTEIAGYWRHDLAGLFGGRDELSDNGLILPRPYESGRIPVVLVHGTASSPTYWSEMLNVLGGDPVIRSKYQFWLFQYDSGSPIAYSTAKLREELITLCKRYDPDGNDPSLNRMIMVGHSQGGLLVKMLAMTLGTDDAAMAAYGKTTAELNLSEEQLAFAKRLYDLEPLPQVERVIFIATPHRGSTLADSWFARMLTRMIYVPGEMVNMTKRLVKGESSERPGGMTRRVHTSLDNMNPKSLFVKISQEAPLDPDVHLHSIIPIGDYETTKHASDGVVRYSSAHLDEAESEVLVPSGHSCQTHPRTLMEVRRILYEELGLESMSVMDVIGDEEEDH